MKEAALVLSVAFIADLLMGDPVYRYHPVRIVGNIITFWEGCLRRVSGDGKVGGVFLLLLTTISTLALFSLPCMLLDRLSPFLSLSFEAFVTYSLLAVKDLASHIEPVGVALRKGRIDDARKFVSMTVSRDVTRLNQGQIAMAAIETLAENLVDGFISPLFWYVTGAVAGRLSGFPPAMTGVIFMLTFKAVSTLDSMVGYMTDEYIDFGWASARMDDIMNFVPARISIPIMFLGSVISRLDPMGGLRSAMQDRLRHDSPNSAHSESFFAGALCVCLGGPAVYGDGLKERPWMGEGNPLPGPDDIDRAISLVYSSSFVALFISILILLTPVIF